MIPITKGVRSFIISFLHCKLIRIAIGWNEDFREEYLDYDTQRQLELESYGYHFQAH